MESLGVELHSILLYELAYRILEHSNISTSDNRMN